VRGIAIVAPMNAASNLPGFLMAIEGIDGAGKTTQAELVQTRLESLGLPVVRTKEPTSGKWGQLLRDSAQTGRLSIADEVETFIKDREEHVADTIRPALQNGAVVIIDRYYFSMAAYQGARGLDPEELLRRNESFAPEPDLLVLLDVEVEKGLERVRARGDRANLFEQTESLRRARDIFLEIKRPYLLRLDARQPTSDICAEICAELALRFRAGWSRHGRAMPERLERALGELSHRSG
jgi:dTMP kinase